MKRKTIKKSYVKAYHNWKIQTKMSFAFVIGVVIPIWGIISISYNINANNMTRQINELAVQNLRQMAERVKLTLDTYNTILLQINADDEVIEYIGRYNSNEPNSKAVAYNYINNRLKQYNHSDLGMRSISIISNEGGPVIYDYQTGSAVSNVWRGLNIYEQAPYLNAKDKVGIILTPTEKYDDNGKPVYLFHLSKQIFDLNDLNKGAIGTAIISIDSSILNTICSEGERGAGEVSHRIHFIVDPTGRVVSYPNLDFNGYQMDAEKDIEALVQSSGYFEKQDMVVNAYVDQTTGWTYYNVYDKDYVLKDVKRSQSIYVIMGFIGLLFAGGLITIAVKQIDKSIKNVVKGMEQVQEGNLEVVVPVESEDEIGHIAQTFNIMTTKVKGLIEEVKIATDKQKNAEIRALEAQINPHFLYNTLDSINWMAIEKDEYEISTMIRNLGVILRYSVNKSNQMVTIEGVVDWLEKYLSLQKMRFNNVFEWVLNIEEETKQVKIHKLLLQPFVENTIIHGFKGIEQGGVLHIDILMSKTRKTIQIIIEDNGHGMSKEQVDLYNNIEEMIKDKQEGIGVQNAFSRMYMYYGNKASWNVKSIPDMGTVIVLELPFEEV
ncbi:cache domain-containing sensor histidine kinase [Niameybacter massiliensis]|uniref:cache domain-containing sensor histidine kinase n=1 Tax=Niameybacter massiliensis TaxID=1658108 RepID=UPI000A98488B|nr:sensor histidine kinase [Niameybacter massiliensis]